jgi:molybdopterin/thiamine biosynthesis adenylyltransferase
MSQRSKGIASTYSDSERFVHATSRNKNLISDDEQQQLKKTVVCFFGLSVGSHAAITWIMESRADLIKIADPDTIEPSNLNRLRYGWDSIGKMKTAVISDQLHGMHPDIIIHSLTKTDVLSMRHFILQTPRPDIIVDETDDIMAKFHFRMIAKKLRIPLICASDVGDNILVDIERYDDTPQPQPFLGRIDPAIFKRIRTLTRKERLKCIIELVGLEYNSEAMLDSLLSIGKTIPTWPQLGATATIAGGIIATVIKKIVLKEQIPSGRYVISLDDIFSRDFHSAVREKKRLNKIKKIRQIFLNQ